MTRVLGLVLMTTTGAVVAPLVTVSDPGSNSVLLTLAGLMAVLGLLFGFLATARHLLWSVFASVVIVASLALGWIAPPPAADAPPGDALGPAALIIPPVALILFSALGARILLWRQGGRARSAED